MNFDQTHTKTHWFHINIGRRNLSATIFQLTLIWRRGKSFVDQLLNTFLYVNTMVVLANDFHNWLKLCFHVINICDVLFWPSDWIFLSFSGKRNLISISRPEYQNISRNFWNWNGKEILFAILVHIEKVYSNYDVMWICLEIEVVSVVWTHVHVASERVRIRNQMIESLPLER